MENMELGPMIELIKFLIGIDHIAQGIDIRLKEYDTDYDLVLGQVENMESDIRRAGAILKLEFREIES